MTIGSSITTGIVKATGAVGIGTVLYDAHKLGKIRADENRRNAIADSCLDAYLDSTKLNETRCTMSKIQDARFRGELKGYFFNDARDFVNSAVGYVKGALEALAQNVIPLGLSALTLLSKGKTSKISAVALGLYGVADIAKNAFAIGQTHTLNKDA